MLKYDEAVSRGWRVLRFTSRMISDGSAAALLQQTFKFVRHAGGMKSLDSAPAKYLITETETEKGTKKMPVQVAPVPSDSYPLCPEGDDILCELQDVQDTVNSAESRFNPGQPQYKWIFVTEELVDEHDMPFTLHYYTGIKYGNEKANFTLLMDKICRNLKPEQRGTLQAINGLIGKKFRLDVIHRPREDGNGVSVKIASIRRAAIAAPKQQATVPTHSNTEYGTKEEYAEFNRILGQPTSTPTRRPKSTTDDVSDLGPDPFENE